MKNHLRTTAALVFLFAVLGGGWLAYRAATHDNTTRAGVMAQGVVTHTADSDVCSTVENAGNVQTTDTAILSVENEALISASPQVRDAFTAFRDAWNGMTPDPLHNALATAALHFHQVCAAVRARP